MTRPLERFAVATAARAPSAVNDMNDAQVDDLLPLAEREASRRHWTPVRVARRAAELFDDLGVRRVLDVGSGAGKFCVVAAARAPRIELVGVEERAHLVAIARGLALELGTTNATFRTGDATRIAWSEFEGFYVFNSFAENAFGYDFRLDQTIEFSPARRVGEVMRVERSLSLQPVGTVLITYWGLGGPIPGSYERLHVEAAGSGWLQVWRRKTAERTDTYWLEEDAGVHERKTNDVGRQLFWEFDDEA